MLLELREGAQAVLLPVVLDQELDLAVGVEGSLSNRGPGKDPPEWCVLRGAEDGLGALRGRGLDVVSLVQDVQEAALVEEVNQRPLPGGGHECFIADGEPGEALVLDDGLDRLLVPLGVGLRALVVEGPDVLDHLIGYVVRYFLLNPVAVHAVRGDHKHPVDEPAEPEPAGGVDGQLGLAGALFPEDRAGFFFAGAQPLLALVVEGFGLEGVFHRVTPFLIAMPGSIAQRGGEGERRIMCAWDGGPTLDFVC